VRRLSSRVAVRAPWRSAGRSAYNRRRGGFALNIVFHYDAGPRLLGRLEELAADSLEVTAVSAADDLRFAELMAEAEVLWHVLRPLSAADIAAAPSLKLIQKIGIGVDTIDLDAAKARDIAVCNMPGTKSAAVAEHTLLLMLATLRRLSQFDRDTRAGRGWGWPPSRQDALGELGGRTVGLVGYGAIPRLLGPILRAMGAQVIYTALQPSGKAVGHWRELDKLLAEADVVSLHVPLTKETRGMIDAAALAKMKPGAVLINTARGELVDEAALAEALTDGDLRGAGLDVHAHEPVADDNPLLVLDNVVVTPHVAWLTEETLARSLEVAVDNCRRLMAGTALVNRVV